MTSLQPFVLLGSAAQAHGLRRADFSLGWDYCDGFPASYQDSLHTLILDGLFWNTDLSFPSWQLPQTISEREKKAVRFSHPTCQDSIKIVFSVTKPTLPGYSLVYMLAKFCLPLNMRAKNNEHFLSLGSSIWRTFNEILKECVASPN